MRNRCISYTPSLRKMMPSSVARQRLGDCDFSTISSLSGVRNRMYLYDQKHDNLQRLRRPKGRPFRVYVCGITPYDTTHLGHAFTYIVYDCVIRYLRTVKTWDVRYIQNLTDIDDDVLKKSASSAQDWRQLGLEWTDRFRGDLAWLGISKPNLYPGATSAIKEIVDQVSSLTQSGHAYSCSGSVYFDHRQDEHFFERADGTYDELLSIANERGNKPDDAAKKDPLDFVLWQAAADGEPAWNSPWGPGRPGWHIECSCLASLHLGSEIDIHGGGADLAFPHHVCEEAQALPGLPPGRPWVRHWMHSAMVEMDGEKMSKSLGNLVLVRDLAVHHHPDQLRLYLLRHHYRQGWEWDPQSFEECQAWMLTFHAAMRRGQLETSNADRNDPVRANSPANRFRTQTRRQLDPKSYGPKFTRCIENDLDTPGAIEVALELADQIIEAPSSIDTSMAQDVLRSIAGEVLGLRLEDFESGPADLVDEWPAPLIADPDLIYRAEGTGSN